MRLFPGNRGHLRALNILGICKLLTRKRALFRVFQHTKSNVDKAKYRRCCSDCSAAIKHARISHEHKVLSSDNLAMFYRYANERRNVRSGLLMMRMEMLLSQTPIRRIC